MRRPKARWLGCVTSGKHVQDEITVKKVENEILVLRKCPERLLQLEESYQQRVCKSNDNEKNKR